MYKENAFSNPPHVINDEKLWYQIKSGDRAGMEALYIKYAQELFRLGMSIKGDRSLVKDCIQEVFLNLWLYRHTVKSTDNVKLYLFKCLSNKIHKEVGKDKKRYGFLVPEMEGKLADYQETDPENSIEKRQRLTKVLNSLPARQQEVIQLLYFENHSYEDTAVIMGINVQSVYTLAWKAVANLKKGFALVSYLFLGFFT